MRAKMHAMSAPQGAIDIVGTGGDGKGTLNISTATAIVVAGCGVTVAKHGNRKASSQSGTADVFSLLGVNLEADYDVVQRAIDEAGIGFMIAPRYHSAMRHVMPTRVELGARTMFNLLGPLSNPASVKRYLLGVFAEQWVEPDSARAWQNWAPNAPGSSTAATVATNSRYRPKTRSPCWKVARSPSRPCAGADAGLPHHDFSAILGGTPEDNAARR